MEPPPLPPSSLPVPPRVPPLIRTQPAVAVPPPLPGGTTIVLNWFIYYRLWCILMALIWAGYLTYGILVASGVVEPSLGFLVDVFTKDDPAARAKAIAEERSDAVGLSIFVGGITLFYAGSVFVPRKPWGWTMGFIAIIGSILPLLLTVAGMIPLLIAWVKPETKMAFLKKP